jgi:hypothetical protein
VTHDEVKAFLSALANAEGGGGSLMALKDLDGRRTGRPKGAKTTSRVRRDILWAYRNLDKPEARPPSAGAKLWAALARDEPARFLACLARLEAQPAADPRAGAARGPVAAGETPGGGAESAIGAVAGRPLRAQRLFVPEQRLTQCLAGDHWLRITNLPVDCLHVIASEADPARGGVWLTIVSPLFEPVPAGEPIPAFTAQWLRDPRSY